MYDVGGKLLNGIKIMYVKSLDCVRVKGDDSKCFRIKSRVRHGCIMSPWLFNAYMDTLMKELNMGMGRRGVRFQEEGRVEIPGLLHADDLVLCGESEEDLKATMGLLLRCVEEEV